MIELTCGASYGTRALCRPVTGSSTYWLRLLPSTRIKWLAGAVWPGQSQQHKKDYEIEVEGQREYFLLWHMKATKCECVSQLYFQFKTSRNNLAIE